MRMARWHMADIAVVGMLHRFPGIAFRVLRMRVMRTREIREGRPVVAGGRRVEFTFSARFVSVMMHAGLEMVARSVVVLFALAMCEIMLCFFSDRTDPANQFT